MKTDSDKSKSSGLSFQSSKDAINYAKQITEDAKHWVSTHNIHLVERYIKGELQIVVLNECAGCGNGKYDLLFNNIPFGYQNSGRSIGRTRNLRMTNVHSTRFNPDRSEHPVLICSAYPIESPNEIIPSFVWLETSQERKNILIEIFGPSLFEHALKISKTVGNGEIGLLGGTDGFASNRNSVPRLIQGDSEIVNRIGGDNCKFIRKRFGKFNLVKIVNSIRICLSDSGVWLSIEKDLDPLFKINDVFLCSTKNEL